MTTLDDLAAAAEKATRPGYRLEGEVWVNPYADFLAAVTPDTVLRLVADRRAVIAALTDEDEVAHGEAIRGGVVGDPRSREGVGRCAYCGDAWPCRTQRGIDRLLAALEEVR